MTPERWQQIDKLLEQALEQESDGRDAFLERACQGDADLRQEVESLLSAHGQAEGFTEAGPMRTPGNRIGVETVLDLTGRQVKHYEILSRLGEGGMGVVYKARDQHLDRFVAIKVLPPELVADPDRKKRFAQEAKAASALNHPNIITIHDIANDNGTDFIVMEYVTGKPLGRLIPRKGIRLPEALKIAIQISDALAAAHAAGIVHRDLKPGNVMLGDNGQVKVLDFGLAKLVQRKRSDQAEAQTQTESSGFVETETGLILGTASYMSPEQAEGKPVDHRSDIFSFGAILYEMITGRRAFQGDSAVAILTAVLREEPKPVNQVVEGLPAELEHIVRRCLRKDPERRWQSIADVRVALREALEESASGESTEMVGPAQRRVRQATIVSGLFACLAALALAVWLWRSFRKSDDPPMMAVPLTTYPGHERYPTFSPDGNQVAFSWNGERQDNFDIYVKLIGAGSPLRLTTHRAEDSGPAWSPDGRWIAFLRDLGGGRAAVLRVPPIGGPERKLGEVYKPWFSFGFPLTWSPSGDSLVITDRESDAEPYGLFVLSIESGDKRRLTSPPPTVTRGDGGPAFAPDGRTIAFVRTVSFGSADLYLLPVGEDLKEAGEPKRLTSRRWQVNNPAWAPEGREVIFSVGFLGFGLFDVSNLWRVAANGSGEPQQLAAGENGFGLSIAPQKHRLVYSREVADINIWRVANSSSQAEVAPERFISSTRDETNPQFSPDGKKVAFSSNRSGTGEIWTCDYDGSNPVQVTAGRGQNSSPRWSPDSRWICFDSNVDGQWEVYVVEADGGKPRRLTSHPALDAVPSWSQDGRWIYFGSNRSGSYQVWKMPPTGGEALQVTQKGGFLPLESLDGKFVYFMKSYDDRHIWKTPVGAGDESEVLGPIFARDYDVVKDGIYFIPALDSSKSQSICFFSFATGEVKSIASVENPWLNYLTVSPDGRWILYPKLDLEGSDLMLVENFR